MLWIFILKNIIIYHNAYLTLLFMGPLPDRNNTSCFALVSHFLIHGINTSMHKDTEETSEQNKQIKKVIFTQNKLFLFYLIHFWYFLSGKR